jgi:lauroyl/myristoyl acyltransferase
VRIHRRCLASEALEEADSTFFMRSDVVERGVFQLDALPVRGDGGAGTVYATLHFGSPVFGFLALAGSRGEVVSIVGRPLDDTNPMPAAKRAYALGKVRWVERVTGRPFLPTDALAMARAREELLAGRSLYTPVDVPGSVAGRAATVRPFGEPIRLASGLMTLARIAGADVVPVVTRSERGRFTVEFGPRLPASLGDALLAETIDALASFVRVHPDEWWMWPYLEPAA